MPIAWEFKGRINFKFKNNDLNLHWQFNKNKKCLTIIKLNSINDLQSI